MKLKLLQFVIYICIDLICVSIKLFAAYTDAHKKNMDKGKERFRWFLNNIYIYIPK